MFKIKKIENKTVYYSDILPVEHFFTTRQIPIDENIDLICKYLKIDSNNLIKPKQTHSCNIEIVRNEKTVYDNCDSLILAQKNKAIYLNFADCTPIVLYDEKNNIASIAHGGWRGTAQKIAAKTVFKMQKIFNSKPENIIALIGPCISFKHFETSPEAICQLKSTVEGIDGLFKNNYADLKGINKSQLEKTGVKKIDVCQFCTVEDNDQFFSYRKENKIQKRHNALIKL